MTRRQLLYMCGNNMLEGNTGVPVWTSDEKRVAAMAEQVGLVRIERTAVLFGGLREWRVSLPEAGRIQIRDSHPHLV